MSFLYQFDGLQLPVQCRLEWLSMLEYCATYFAHRRIEHPIILEIGTRLNQQKSFYEKLLGARHIGIDISDKEAVPDIVGDSTVPETIVQIRSIAPAIDLLFIDGSHEYEGVKRDYEIYAPMTRHIIAFHDINIDWPGFGIQRFWEELKVKEQRQYTFISIDSWTEPELNLGYASRLGIGLAVRKEPLIIS